jgi:uncharacterized iron-regulated membrane protein
MRSVHRIVSLFVVLFTLYLGVTGTLIQLIDLRTLFSHVPASDPNMMAIREGGDGPDDYQVIVPADYSAAALPGGFDFGSALGKMQAAAQAAAAGAPVVYAEIRMSGSGPAGTVELGGRTLLQDLTTGQYQLGPTPPPPHFVVPSQRNTVKALHRMTAFGNWPLWINPLVGVGLGVFVVTGVVMYLQMLRARRRIRRRALFWSAGGWWRSLHRWISIGAALFILCVALSGTWLAVESLGLGLYFSSHGPPSVSRHTIPAPLPAAAQLPVLLTTTLRAQHSLMPDQPLKVVRLRMYGGMPQGVVIAGQGDDTRQVVFNASTGNQVTETEPGYPPTGFPFGWQAHQVAKQIHRGDFIGLSGRWMDLIAGVSIVFLSLSGAVMYFDMWNRRRRAGRSALVWS